LFEAFGKPPKVATVRRAFRQKMNVIRHRAKRVKEKSARAAYFRRCSKTLVSFGTLRENRTPLFGADRHEIGMPPAIAFGWQTNFPLPIERHLKMSAHKYSI
jgi:hypothetical protein